MAIPKLPVSKGTVTAGTGGVIFVFWEPIRTVFEIGAEWSDSWAGVLHGRLDFLLGGNFQFGILLLLTIVVGKLFGRHPEVLDAGDSSESGDAGGMPVKPAPQGD
jgi:hypothetical protein